jgi:hypothetical protein
MTEQSLVRATLDEMKKDGLPVKEGSRSYQSKRMTGFNADVYSAWIARWARNAAINYPVVSDGWGIRFLRKSATGIPAVVVGIGPSLDDNMEALRYARERALLIATDAAVRPLLRHGIKPDLVVNYDARDEQATMWETIDTSDLTLVANSVTSPRTIAAWQGKIIFFNMLQLDDEFATNILPAMYPHLGDLPNMGTVGNGAIYMANEMGCSPILTIGMDLCYKRVTKKNELGGELLDHWRYRCKDYIFKPNDVEFPEGWIETENRVLYDNDTRMAKTFDVDHKGQTFRIDEPLRFYANSIIQNIGSLDLPVIDCSGGVLAKYIRHIPLKEALATKCSKQIYPAQTTVRYLSQLVPDCKMGRVFDGEYWRDPTRGEKK